MLKPTKHLNPELSVLNIASIMVKYLQRERIVSYEKLISHIKKKNIDMVELFLPTVSFLYSLGLVEYYLKTDSFEFLGSNAIK